MEKEDKQTWQARLYKTIYESDTIAGKAFDVTLLFLIFTSILVVMLDSVAEYHSRFGNTFFILEGSYTILFTLEYVLRLICIKRPFKYIFSFLGVIDLLAIIPSYLSVFFIGAQSLLVFRALRLLRVFRIFKLSHFLSEMKFLGSALKGSLRKISIFMLIVLALVIILGSIMYLIEKRENGFTSIPESIYWAIVTITTVGYGDISPVTPAGKFVASIIMLIGYGIIAVPTGIITNELFVTRGNNEKARACNACGKKGHDTNAKFCDNCGAAL